MEPSDPLHELFDGDVPAFGSVWQKLLWRSNAHNQKICKMRTKRRFEYGQDQLSGTCMFSV